MRSKTMNLGAHSLMAPLAAALLLGGLVACAADDEQDRIGAEGTVAEQPAEDEAAVGEDPMIADEQAAADRPMAGADEDVGEPTDRRMASTRDDEAITAEVQRKLTADPEIDPLAVDVETRDGVVRLSGDIRNEEDRRVVERLARETEGVERVEVELQIADATPGTAEDDDAFAGTAEDDAPAGTAGDRYASAADDMGDPARTRVDEDVEDRELGAADEVDALPRTASPVPLILLAGLAGLGLAAALQWRSRL